MVVVPVARAEAEKDESLRYVYEGKFVRGYGDEKSEISFSLMSQKQSQCRT